MTTTRTAARATAFALACLVTLGVLVGLDALSSIEHGNAVLARALALQPA